MRHHVTVVIALMLLVSLSARGQTLGSVTGSVTDSSGAVIVGAAVTIKNPQTSFTRQVTTNNSGNYTFPALQPGVYDISVENPGFQTATRAGVELQVQQTARINFSLKAGAVTETVNVEGGAPLVNTENATVGTVVDTHSVADLPLNGRNFLGLTALSPNVNSGFGVSASITSGGASTRQGGDRAAVAISVAGQRREYNSYTIDGVNDTDPNYNLYVFLPSIDLIQEFKVQTGIYSAEFGRGIGQINVSTKSGTNDYHGTTYDFFRNSVMDAKPYAFTSNSPAAPLKWNQFGFTLGGPVQIPKVFNGKDRLFFMVAYEGFREGFTTDSVFSTPPQVMRDGNLSQLLPGTVLMNPHTNNGAGVKVPYAGNIIPVQDISPISTALLKYLPLPNVAGSKLSNNYLLAAANINNKNQFTERTDFVESSTSSWFGRYSWSHDYQTTPGIYESGQVLNNSVNQATISNIRILSPTVVNEARFGFSGFANDNFGDLSNKVNVIQQVGLPQFGNFGPFDYGIPSVSMTGYSGFGETPENPYELRDYSFDGVDGLTWTRGKHTVKVGADVRRDRFNLHGNYATRGTLGFQTQATGYGLGDYLTGFVNAGVIAANDVSTQLRVTSQAYYITDNWKARSNLTVDVGLRYEFTPPWSDKNSAYSNLSVPYYGSAPQPVGVGPQPTLCRSSAASSFYQGLNVQFGPGIQTGVGCMGDRMMTADYKNFAPRLGIAWSPTSKWTVRTGAGFFYVQDVTNAYFDISRNLAGRITDTANTVTNNLTIDNPYGTNPGAANACGTANPPYCITLPGFLYAQYNRRTPYVIQYEMNIQRELPKSTLVEVGYFGSESHFLPRTYIFNAPIPGTGSVAARTAWPLLGTVSGEWDGVNANYNSLSAKVTHRLTNGLSALASYTFSKAIDDGSGYRTFSQENGTEQNPACIDPCERGLSAFDARHRIVASVLYQLPFGKGRTWLTKGIGSQVFGGWQFSTIISYSTGNPVGITDGTNRSGTGISDRPNATGQSVALSNPTASEWFNIDAFALEPATTFGNVGRNPITGPGILNWDVSTLKEIPLNERFHLQFRAEAFNIMNHPNLGLPATSLSADTLNSAGQPVLGSGALGSITSTQTNMRQIQLALKLMF